MSEKPLLMNGFGVKATLAGKKIMTRRPMRVQPTSANLETLERSYGGCCDIDGYYQALTAGDMGYEATTLRSPYGHYGDLLYVRETCRAEELPNGVDGIRYAADNAFIEIENTKEAGEQWTKMYNYRHGQGLWIPSIHMPKVATRLWLINEGTGVERLQDISWQDAEAEGWPVDQELFPTVNREVKTVRWFSKLWDSVYSAPKSVHINGIVDHYVSYPWDNVQEVGEHRGKLWFIVGNAWLWKLRYSIREKRNNEATR